MAHWVHQARSARHYAATTPGFLPALFVTQVQLTGTPVDYVTYLGYDVKTVLGDAMIYFYSAFYTFSLERMVLGLGMEPYTPGPLAPNDLLSPSVI
jgi:hypothetical protein